MKHWSEDEKLIRRGRGLDVRPIIHGAASSVLAPVRIGECWRIGYAGDGDAAWDVDPATPREIPANSSANRLYYVLQTRPRVRGVQISMADATDAIDFSVSLTPISDPLSPPIWSHMIYYAGGTFEYLGSGSSPFAPYNDTTGDLANSMARFWLAPWTGVYEQEFGGYDYWVVLLSVLAQEESETTFHGLTNVCLMY